MTKSQATKRAYNSGASNGTYGLGFVGATFYFIQQAPTFWDGVIGVLKAMLWPAFVVYELAKFFNL